MIPRSSTPDAETPNQRYNFSPSAAQAGKYFILSSSAELARSLITTFKSGDGRTGAGESPETAIIEADGPELARVLESNRSRLAIPLVLDRGLSRARAESQVELGLSMLGYLGHGRLTIRDEPSATSLTLKFQLDNGRTRQPAK
jgi:hypothetical protein